MRQTYQELGDVIHEVGVKKVSNQLGISSSLIYKWCQEPKSDENPEASGAANPLDRLFAIMEMADHTLLVDYIARHAGGYFSPNPEISKGKTKSFLSETIGILDKFADMMRFAEQSLTNDGAFDEEETIQLRRFWDRLKSRLEGFIGACEAGHFDQPPSAD